MYHLKKGLLASSAVVKRDMSWTCIGAIPNNTSFIGRTYIVANRDTWQHYNTGDRAVKLSMSMNVDRLDMWAKHYLSGNYLPYAERIIIIYLKFFKISILYKSK